MSARFGAALALLVLAACARGPELPVLGQVTDFELVDQAGKPFAENSLRGEVWIADWIYTNCPGPCPMMSSRMSQLQKRTLGTGIQFVSFTVDPARDTPAVLARYADRYHRGDRWVFLTGDKSTLNALDRDVFHLGTLDDAFTHSTRFTLVDGRGRIRGYYSFGDEDMIGQIVRDAKRLTAQEGG